MTDNFKKNLAVFLLSPLLIFFVAFVGYIASPNKHHGIMELVMILTGSCVVAIPVSVVLILIVSRGANARKWEPAGTALYLVVYSVVAFKFLTFLFNTESEVKIFAWILGLITVTMILTILKKQRLLVSALTGTLLGPVGWIIILLARPDITAYPEEDKDRRFYEMLARMMDRQFDRLIKGTSGSVRSRIVTSDFVSLVDYFSVDLTKIQEFTETEVNLEDQRAMEIFREIFIGKRRALEIFRELYTAFNNECLLKFGSKFNGVDERIEEIERKVEEFKSALR